MDERSLCLLKEEWQGLDQKPGILADWVSGYEFQKIWESFLKLLTVPLEDDTWSWSKT